MALYAGSWKEDIHTKYVHCDSVRIYDKFYGAHECFRDGDVFCAGEIVDQVILENPQLIRMGRVPNTRYRKR